MFFLNLRISTDQVNDNPADVFGYGLNERSNHRSKDESRTGRMGRMV